MLALLEHPDQWKLLRDDPGRIPTAVEEILRYTSVVKHFVRTATEDTELAGRRIAEGDKLVMWFISASRDQELNPDPGNFDITRDNPQHRAFGAGGPHFCLGNALARLELKVIYEELARRVPDIQLDGPVAYLGSNWVHGLTSMPVVFAPGKVLTGW
jgi:cytochrome P450